MRRTCSRRRTNRRDHCLPISLQHCEVNQLAANLQLSSAKARQLNNLHAKVQLQLQKIANTSQIIKHTCIFAVILLRSSLLTENKCTFAVSGSTCQHSRLRPFKIFNDSSKCYRKCRFRVLVTKRLTVTIISSPAVPASHRVDWSLSACATHPAP